MAEQGQVRPKRGGAVRLIVTAVFMLPVVAVLLPTCLVLVTGMVPTAVAYVMDRSRDKALAISIGLLNFCGTLPGIIDLWAERQAYEVATRIATDPFFWLMAYAAAGLGWLICLALPPVVATYYGAISRNRIQAIRRRQASLTEAWGKEVSGQAGQ